MTARHTPGPWEVWRNGIVRAPMADRSRPNVRQVIARTDSPWLVRQPGESDADLYVRAEQEQNANARLIAAAPALLEALEAINGCIAWSDTAQQWHLLGRERTQPALELVRAAIAAAKGGGG